MAEQWNGERPIRERRRRKRTPLVCRGEYLVVDGGHSSAWEPCSLLDLSLDGTAIATGSGELHRGQQILLRLAGVDPAHGRALLELQAVVIHRRSRPDRHVYGLTFPALAPFEKKELLRIVIAAYRQPELSRP